MWKYGGSPRYWTREFSRILIFFFLKKCSFFGKVTFWEMRWRSKEAIWILGGTWVKQERQGALWLWGALDWCPASYPQALVQLGSQDLLVICVFSQSPCILQQLTIAGVMNFQRSLCLVATRALLHCDHLYGGGRFLVSTPWRQQLWSVCSLLFPITVPGV